MSSALCKWDAEDGSVAVGCRDFRPLESGAGFLACWRMTVSFLASWCAGVMLMLFSCWCSKDNWWNLIRWYRPKLRFRYAWYRIDACFCEPWNQLWVRQHWHIAGLWVPCIVWWWQYTVCLEVSFPGYNRCWRCRCGCLPVGMQSVQVRCSRCAGRLFENGKVVGIWKSEIDELYMIAVMGNHDIGRF